MVSPLIQINVIFCGVISGGKTLQSSPVDLSEYPYRYLAMTNLQ